MRCSCSFRSATDYRSPINGLSEINRCELFYKHCIPTGFPDSLLQKHGVNQKASYLQVPGVHASKMTFCQASVRFQLLPSFRRFFLLG